MRVLKWGVPGTSQRSLQTLKQAGGEECSQPQWRAAAARPAIGGLPPARFKGLPIQPVTQNLSTEKDLSASGGSEECDTIDWSLETSQNFTCSLHVMWLKSWPSQRNCRKPLRSESTSSIRDPPQQQLHTSWSCWVQLPFLSSHYAGGC